MQYPEEFDFRIIQGESFTLTRTYKDANGAPIDVSGYQATMTIYQDLPCGGNCLLTDGDGITLDINGNVTYTLTDEETPQLPVGGYSYFSFLINGSSSIAFQKGKVSVIGPPPENCGACNVR